MQSIIDNRSGPSAIHVPDAERYAYLSSTAEIYIVLYIRLTDYETFIVVCQLIAVPAIFLILLCKAQESLQLLLLLIGSIRFLSDWSHGRPGIESVSLVIANGSSGPCGYVLLMPNERISRTARSSVPWRLSLLGIGVELNVRH